MAVQQNKKSPSKRGMHRSHNALVTPGTAIEPTTGEVHLRLCCRTVFALSLPALTAPALYLPGPALPSSSLGPLPFSGGAFRLLL